VQHKRALLLDVLDRDKTHRWPRDDFADRPRIGSIIKRRIVSSLLKRIPVILKHSLHA
jgi:hypothetical protein